MAELGNMITRNLKEYVSKLVKEELNIIPHLIREELEHITTVQFRQSLREKLEESIVVEIKVKDRTR
jgi:hypothetical protein